MKNKSFYADEFHSSLTVPCRGCGKFVQTTEAEQAAADTGFATIRCASCRAGNIDAAYHQEE